MYLRCAVHDNPNKWTSWLPLNTNYHSSLGCSPFKALYGYDPIYGMFSSLLQSDNVDLEQWLREHQTHSALLKAHLLKAQAKIKLYADQPRSARSFTVGEFLYLKLQPYAQTSVVNRPCAKLANKYYGPFEIVECIGPAAYKLQLPAEALIHPVFHVSQLKAHIPDHTPVFSQLPAAVDLSTVNVWPEKILDRKMVKKNNAVHVQVLIQWSSLPSEAAMWEDFKVLRCRYPTAPAWGHAGSQGGGTVSSVPLTTKDQGEDAGKEMARDKGAKRDGGPGSATMARAQRESPSE